jgi:hypothetical protein
MINLSWLSFSNTIYIEYNISYFANFKIEICDYPSLASKNNLQKEPGNGVFKLTCSNVPDPGKGVCGDPVNGGAILGKGGPGPQGGNKERQLNPDKGREKTR